jgi:hypothetical protein
MFNQPAILCVGGSEIRGFFAALRWDERAYLPGTCSKHRYSNRRKVRHADRAWHRSRRELKLGWGHYQYERQIWRQDG